MPNIEGVNWTEDGKVFPVTKGLWESYSWIIESLMRISEISSTITLDNGIFIQLIKISNEKWYISNRAIIVDGARYDLVPWKVMKYRDWGSTLSLFESWTKVLELYLPVQGNNRSPTLTTKKTVTIFSNLPPSPKCIQ